MNCHDVRDLLVAYLDDEMSPAERAAIQAHLTECEACQREFRLTSQMERRVRRSLIAMADQAEVPAQAWSTLQARLATQPASPSLTQSGGSSMMNLAVRKPLIAVAVLVVILAASIVGLVAPVRAQVVDAVTTWLRIPMAGSSSGVTVPESIVPFRPLVPAYLPEGYHNSYMVSGGESGKEVLELRAFSAEQFVIIFEHHTSGEHSLPDGEDILVGGQPASLETGLQGTTNILAPAPQPDHADLFTAVNGGGGGGGDGADPRASLPETLTYTDGVRVTWYVDDTKVEILSNETPEETLKIAESMTPVEVIEAVEESLPLSDAPDTSQTPDTPADPAGEAYIIHLPNGGGEMPVNGLGFTPYAPTYLPFDVMGGGGGGNGQQLELTFTDTEMFIQLSQAQVSEAGSLPTGESVTVNGEAAVLVTGLTGSLTAQPAISYTDGTELTWQIDGVQITLLTNLPAEEAIKIAESMVPAQAAPLP